MAIHSKLPAYLKFNIGLILLYLATTVFPVNAQEIYKPDHVVYNQLNNFLGEYENMINEEGAFDESGFSYILGNYFYSDEVEMFNDLDNGKEYLTWGEYRKKASQMSEDCYMDFKHYDLKITKRNNYKYYDIIEAGFIKEIKYACGNTDTLNIKRLNYNITLIYYKYRVNNIFPLFRILKMDLAGKSFKPGAWYRGIIPDEISINISPLYNMPNLNQSEIELDMEPQWGYQGGIGLNYLVTGGRNDILVFSGGVGFTKTSSKFKLGSYQAVIYNDVDKDGDTYDREIYGKDIEQTLKYSTIDIPLMLSWRHFLGKSWQLSLSTGLRTSYLIDQSYKTDNGEFEYRGLYHDLYGQEFYLFNLPSYGFSVYPSNNATGSNPKLNDLIFSWQSSLHASFKAAKYFDLFFGPSFSLGLNNLVQSTPDDYVVSKYNGDTDPLINLADGFNIMSAGFEIGVRFTLNDISRSFVPNLKFEKEQRKLQEVNHNQYFEELFYTDDGLTYQQGVPGKSENKTRKVHVKQTPNDCFENLVAKPRPNDILFKIRGKYEAQNKNSFTRANGKIMLPDTPLNVSDTDVLSGKGLYLHKPYGFNIALSQSEKFINLDSSTFYLPIGNNASQLEIIPVSPLNIYIYNINNKATNKLSPHKDMVYKKYFALIDAKNGRDESCFTYFWNGDYAVSGDDGTNLGCLKCNEDLLNSQEKIPALLDKDDPVNLAGDIGRLLGNRFTPARRDVRLHFIIADIGYVRELLQGELNIFMRDVDPNWENISEINLYFNFSEINKLDYIGGIESPVQFIDQIKYQVKNGLRSVQLKNVYLHDLKLN